MERIDLKSMDLPELEAYTASLGQPRFRAKQIFSWLHEKRVTGFDEMRNLPETLRRTLAETCGLPVLTVERKLTSKLDGTVKYLFRLPDGEVVESVVMRYEHGLSICISSQVGCRMGCTFCASTKAGFVRNLTPAELLEQVYAAGRDTKERISHVVLMGIGEPLDNYDNVLRFLRLVTHPAGMNLSMRHISLSTCGLADRIDALAKEKLGITLSVSLHAADDSTRSAVMPVARRWKLDKLLQSCKKYSNITSRRISFEYALIRGQNDSPEDARRLAGLLKGQLCHVNLIPVNPVRETAFQKPDRKRTLAFQQELIRRGVNATIRRTMGSDIDAACGQLRRDNLERTE